MFVACSCNPDGSISRLCDSVSGQCLCKPLFTARDCSTCIEGYGNVTAGCRECNCDVGAITSACDQITGSCVCAPGVTSDKCDVCEADHYGLSIDGCKGECNNLSFDFIFISFSLEFMRIYFIHFIGDFFIICSFIFHPLNPRAKPSAILRAQNNSHPRANGKLTSFEDTDK